MPSLDELAKWEETLTAGCEKHLASGGKLISGLFSNGKGGCCPIWASIDPKLIEGKNGSLINLVHYALRTALGFNFKELEMDAFLAGYDELKQWEDDSDEMYVLGQKFREKYWGRQGTPPEVVITPEPEEEPTPKEETVEEKPAEEPLTQN